MKTKRYETLLFDMDGTVLNSDPMILETMNILYDKYRNGVRTPEEKIYYFSGPPIRETLKTEFPDMDQAFIYKEFHDVSYSLYKTHTFPYPHSREVLLKLKEAGFNLGVVTNKIHFLTEYALECIGLGDIFTFIIGSDDVSKVKPDKEGMEKARNHFGSSKEKTIYIGDNTTDYQSAVNAGIDCCLVNWGPRVLPKDLSPKYRINSYLDLEGILYE